MGFGHRRAVSLKRPRSGLIGCNTHHKLHALCIVDEEKELVRGTTECWMLYVISWLCKTKVSHLLFTVAQSFQIPHVLFDFYLYYFKFKTVLNIATAQFLGNYASAINKHLFRQKNEMKTSCRPGCAGTSCQRSITQRKHCTDFILRLLWHSLLSGSLDIFNCP